MKKPTKHDMIYRSGKTYISDFLTTFTMTLINPVTFVTFTVILTDLGIIARHIDWVFDAEFAVSVFAGTVVFWAALNFIIHIFKKYSPFRLYLVINYATGFALIILGIMLFFYAFHTSGIPS